MHPEQLLCQKATWQRVPVNGILELTPLCNMHCKMCYVRLSSEAMKHQGRLRTLDEWIHLAEELQKAGTVFVLLTGGEPLLYPDFKKLYLVMRKLGMILTINTNGTLVDEEWAHFFGKYKPRRINITLYGKDEEAYARVCGYPEGFERTIRAIRLLKEQGVDVKINGTLIRDNGEDAMGILQLARELGVYCKVDTYVYPAEKQGVEAGVELARMTPEKAAGWRIHLQKEQMNEEEFRTMAERMVGSVGEPSEPWDGKLRCRAGRSSFFVDWKGQMTPCIFMKEPVCQIFSGGFDEGWQRIVQETLKIRLSKTCGTCHYQKVCETCAACAMAECGEAYGTPEYMCRYTKESIRLLKKEVRSMEDATENGNKLSESAKISM